ncbi:hypothetical protein IAI18_05295 [Acetobacteraceae bacterium H6797]|nr:hypothetical protein [Acetobacteraceae bacterium H6797]
MLVLLAGVPERLADGRLKLRRRDLIVSLDPKTLSWRSEPEAIEGQGLVELASWLEGWSLLEAASRLYFYRSIRLQRIS